MDNANLEELSLNDILEKTVKSYDDVLSSHEEILTAKAQLMENQLALLRKQIHIVSKDLEDIADKLEDTRLHDICRRLRNIATPPSARNKATRSHLHQRPSSMITTTGSPRIQEIKRCASESQPGVKMRKKSITMERLEDRQFRTRNSICHVSQRDPKLDYQLSPDLLAMQHMTIAKKYGDPTHVIKAAVTIQRAWRKYCLNKTFTRIKLETPLRTKSMNNKTKPIISITRESDNSENNGDNVRQVLGDNCDLTPLAQFKRNDICRQIIRAKSNSINSSSSEYSFTKRLEFAEEEEIAEFLSREGVYKYDTEFKTSADIHDKPRVRIQHSEPADFKVPVLPKRRNTDNYLHKSSESLDNDPPIRPHSTSWSNFNRSSCSSTLGERVSGDGAEYPDDPVTEVDSKYHSPEAEKYSSLWNSITSDPEKKQLCRNYKLGVHKFNKHPSRGIKHLTTCGVVNNTPHDIAAFLLNGKALSLSQIGNFITDLRKTLSMQVLEEFMKQIDFTNLPFEQALRHFISKLRLPGEAQKIDKLMEAFAERYCECNPKRISESQDTIYVLAFSVIILQTDLHNPQIKLHRKMDVESFVQNNRGIDNGNDLDRELLEAIYEGVRKEPIISGRDHLDFLESIDKSIVGKKMSLMDAGRMLMMSTKMQEIINKNEKPIPDKHIRHIFLFNDVLVITKILQVRGKATTKATKERAISTSSFQYRQHYLICSFKAATCSLPYYPYGIALVDIYDESKVLVELAAHNEDDRKTFLAELNEVTWVHRALENERIGNLGVSDKLNQSTLSLHSFNSDNDGGRRQTNTLGRRFFRTNIFKSTKREALGPSSSLFYTKGISSNDIRTSSAVDNSESVLSENDIVETE